MRIQLILALGLALTVAACAQAPKKGPVLLDVPGAAAKAPAAPAVVATPGLSARERQRKAIELLGTGQSVQARAELAALLEEQPGNRAAKKLLDQIDLDPKVLMGERNYPYKVRPGETFSVLAERLLGDPLMFYGLARYNGVSDPSQAEVGQTLLIPGVPRKAAPAQATAAKPAAPLAAVRDPTRAGKLRGQALEQMNRGRIGQAVALLRQAQALDPANAVIQKDLDRAQRIQANVMRR